MLEVLTVLVLAARIGVAAGVGAADIRGVGQRADLRNVIGRTADLQLALVPETKVICGLLIVWTRPLVAMKEAIAFAEIIPVVTAQG